MLYSIRLSFIKGNFITLINNVSWRKVFWVSDDRAKLKYHFYHNFFNPLNTKRRLFYLKAQFVPRSKHFSSRL